MTTFIDYSKLRKIRIQNKKQDLKEIKEEVIKDLAEEAETLQHSLKKFKEQSFSKINSYMDTAHSSYGLKMGGYKGNVTLTSKDGTYKICKHVQDRIVLDEKLAVAKSLLDKCLNKWSEGSQKELKEVINLAFNVDKEGKVNIPTVLSLKNLSIEDEDWTKAMEAITDAISVVDTKEYIRFYKRGEHNKWQPISLEISKL